MRILLSILGIVGLTTTGASNVVACKEEKVKAPKPVVETEKNKWQQINFKEINDIKNEFKNYNNKWYFITWKYEEKNVSWQSNLFKFDGKKEFGKGIKLIIDLSEELKIFLKEDNFYEKHVIKNIKLIKSLYIYNGDIEPNKPIINEETGKVIDWNLK